MAADSPRSNGVKLELSIAPPRGKPRAREYFVLGHDSRLAQVVTNLIDNACSFSEPGGAVRVSLVRTRRQTIRMRAALGDRIVMTVDDDGPGIPPHALERIFERFYTDRPSQGFGQNSGLGLVDIAPDRGGPRRPDLGVQPSGAREPATDEARPTRRRTADPARRRRPLCRFLAGDRPMIAPGDIASASLHATVVVYLEAGVLIRGPSGSGKSALALALLMRARDLWSVWRFDRRRPGPRRQDRRPLDRARRRKRRRTHRKAGDGSGRGPIEPATVVRLVVDLAERGTSWPRMPDEAEESADVCGVRLPRLRSGFRLRGPADQALAAHERLVAMLGEQSDARGEFCLNIAPQCTKMRILRFGPDRSAAIKRPVAIDGYLMIGMVLVTHGQLATGFRAALEHVVGPAVAVRDDRDRS